MHRGYIKLWRKSLDGGMLKNHKLWVFWSWCLMKASHKPHTQTVGFQEVHLEPGQFIFGRKAAAKDLGVSERGIRTCLKYLKKSKNVTIKTTNKYSVLTVVNWEIYQGDDTENDQQNDTRVTNKRPASDQQVTTNKNVKNVKNDNTTPPNPPRVVDRFSETEIEIEQEAKRIIAMVNDVLGKHFPDHGGHMNLIKKHLRGGIGEKKVFEQFELVTRKKQRDPHFIANPNLLRPSTLFGPKFEEYLEEDENAYGGVKEPAMITHDTDGQDWPVDCEA